MNKIFEQQMNTIFLRFIIDRQKQSVSKNSSSCMFTNTCQSRSAIGLRFFVCARLRVRCCRPSAWGQRTKHQPVWRLSSWWQDVVCSQSKVRFGKKQKQVPRETYQDGFSMFQGICLLLLKRQIHRDVKSVTCGAADGRIR